MSGVLTPDFYTYVWTSLAEVGSEGRFVVVRWPDGFEGRFFDLWLRENAIGAGGVDPATREGIFDPAAHTTDTKAQPELLADGSLRIRFEPDGAEAEYHPGWLRHVAEQQHLPGSWLPEVVPWTTELLTEPPSHDGAAALVDDDVLLGWVEDLVRYGVARLRNLPADPDVGLAIGGRIGAIRDTNFGQIWDVKADVTMIGSADTNSTANSNIRLAPHTDLPTRETPPGFQFLHCIENTTEGGFSTMTDGAAVVAHLAEQHPDDYEALTTLRWIFFNRGPGIDHRWSGPMIDLGVPGSPLTLRSFPGVRAFPDMADADMERAYSAMARFSQLAAAARFQMCYPFAPGDMVGFDNRRIMHGRDAYEANGHRHLRGIYIDHDEINSFTRSGRRRMHQQDRTQQDQTQQDQTQQDQTQYQVAQQEEVISG